MSQKSWTPEEDLILRASYRIKSAEEIALSLKRTKSSVHKRALRLKLTNKMEKRTWTEAECSCLREAYERLKDSGAYLDEMANQLGRTRSSVQHQLSRLSITEMQHESKEWSDQEISFIREHMWKLSYEEIAARLDRTVSSILHKVQRLGLADKHLYFDWSAELKATLNGLLLGDGNYKKNSDYSVSFRLSQKSTHKDWIDSLVTLFQKHRIYTTTNIIPAHQRTTKKGVIINSSEHLYLYTASYATFLPEQKRWYPASSDEIKIIPKDIDIADTSLLAHWYMGDGTTYIDKRGYISAALCTHCFSKEDVLWLQNEFEAKLDLKFSIKMVRKTQPLLCIYGDNAHKFFDMIRDKITPSFHYKVPERGKK